MELIQSILYPSFFLWFSFFFLCVSFLHSSFSSCSVFYRLTRLPSTYSSAMRQPDVCTQRETVDERGTRSFEFVGGALLSRSTRSRWFSVLRIVDNRDPAINVAS